jgi:hypothetical protein
VLIIVGGREPEKGRSLLDTDYEFRRVAIYRAVKRDEAGEMPTSFLPMDYVVINNNDKFARGHADHNAAVGDDSVVLKAVVEAKDVFEASNPGEWFYGGPEVEGRVVYKPTP